MKTEFIQGIENYKTTGKLSAVATLGTFDGIHLGHQAILEQVQEEATQHSSIPVLITFNPHPQVVLNPEKAPLLLTSGSDAD